MINISEHHGFKVNDLESSEVVNSSLLDKPQYSKYVKRNKVSQLCYSINQVENNTYKIESTYMVGIDWVVEHKLPIYVEPKLNNGNTEVDYLKMLFEATQDSENYKHLEDLYTIDFNAPLIEVEQKDDKLTPLLLLEFLQLLKQIVRKGLKKSYYKVTNNLNSRVKGKLLISATVKLNHSKNRNLYQVCQYEEFGYNSIENKVLKMALKFTQSILSQLQGINTTDFHSIYQYVSPAFNLVDDQIDLREIKAIKPNPLFKEYKHALRLAQLILKKYGYNISKTTDRKIKTPPFWIDMSKLFELYVFKKLREVFPKKGEVLYHEKFYSLEPDYLLKSNDGQFQMVVDAKYKPKYENENISHDDGRQVSGYARLKKIREKLKLNANKEIVDTLIIYTNNNSPNIDIVKEELFSKEDQRYYRLFKYSIQLPVIG